MTNEFRHARITNALADRIVERGQSEWQRLQDARARKAGRAIEFTPSYSHPLISTGPTCPRCDGGVVLTGNVALCRSRSCRWQGTSDVVQADYKGIQMAEALSA